MSDPILPVCPGCASFKTMFSPPVNDPPDDDETLNGWQLVCQSCGYTIDIPDPTKGDE